MGSSSRPAWLATHHRCRHFSCAPSGPLESTSTAFVMSNPITNKGRSRHALKADEELMWFKILRDPESFTVTRFDARAGTRQRWQGEATDTVRQQCSLFRGRGCGIGAVV